jgi:hypothetical protein
MCFGPTNALVRNKTLIQMSHSKFQFTIYNGLTNALVRNKTLIEMSHTEFQFTIYNGCIVWRGMSTCRHASPHNTTIIYSELKFSV